MSTTAVIPYYGRAFKLTLTPQAAGGEEWTIANSGWAAEMLKITFTTQQQPTVRYWFADIVIYNFLPGLRQVIQAGDDVSLVAGYQSPSAGLIFQGKVFQPLWQRADETDFTLTLHCLVGLWIDQQGYVTARIPAKTKRSDAIRLVAAAASPAINVEYLDPALDTLATNPRVEIYAGAATKYFADCARAASLNYWQDWNGIVIRSLAPQGSTPDIVYIPPFATSHAGTVGGIVKATLLGTPQQTPEGVVFQVLLDSYVTLGMLVKLDAVLITQISLSPGQLPPMNPDGVYVVASIQHRGDTRGDEWVTEIVGMNRKAALVAALIASR
jgi:hypothetical protein